MFITRFISSIIVLPIVAILTWRGGIYFVLLIAITIAIASYELSKMLINRGYSTHLGNPIITGVLGFIGIFLIGTFNLYISASIVIPTTLLLLGTTSMLYLIAPKSPSRQSIGKWVQNILFVITPPLFTIGFLNHIMFIRNGDNGLNWIFILIIITSLNDSGAFIFGKLIGKRPFFPFISPNKTLEGSISGIILGTLGGLSYKIFTDEPDISILTIIFLSIGLTIFGQMGDLFESGMKRLSKIKDSGNIIPGHGGVLDRVYSFVFTVPVLYYFIQWSAL